MFWERQSLAIFSNLALQSDIAFSSSTVTSKLGSEALVGTGAGVFRLISKSRVFSVFNFSRHFFFVSSRFAVFEFMIVVIGEHRNCRLPYRIFIAFGTFLTTLQHMSRVVLDWTQLSSIKSELFRQVHGHSVESKLAPSTTESGWT